MILRCDHTNTYPIIDPVSTVVLQADTRNIETVFVAGEVLKRDGTLVEPNCGVHATSPRRRSTTCSAIRPSSRTGCRARAVRRASKTG